ncbi:leukocyte elastase inhibitor isoform X1 [Ictalurus furcatus]|uniref:leukocyte elastase inhibitor isoform X1 n=1 Tax=Ictalurus furcatus TaxID=66913 RepID=UPI002350660F|nr:leukocyte elastase inhibitor isoform X1 [Ictalurus furcatus]XP_053470799.1 leukocyte elastase inhibitor isoform X1 [Ictalurus furcatus]
MESLSVANTNFALHLFTKIKEGNKTGNVFYSPLSISSALAMVSLGAAGNTATQMSEVLCFNKPVKPKSVQPVAVQQAQQSQKVQLPSALPKVLHHNKAKDDVHVSFNKLMAELNKAGAPYALSMANRLYGEQTYKFVEKFLKETKTHYHAELETVDFKANAESARVNINNWVEKQTKEKIKNLLEEGTVDNLTRLVLVNAIYFKGSWEKQFDVEATQKRPFKLNKKETKPVQMMNQDTEFPLALIPDLRCKILEIPYKGKELSMLIMLPFEIEDNTTGLEKLEHQLTYDNFMEWTQPDRMRTVEVQVSLPRFTLEKTYDMKELLISMGMVDAFDKGKCDFSHMSPCDDLVLSKVVHKSFVEVNEEGTEAAAATAAGMMTRCFRPTPKELFVADHPFLFFIQHKPTRSILFCGRYSSP